MHIWTTTKSSYYYNLRCLLRINGHNLCLSYYKSEGAPRRAQSTRTMINVHTSTCQATGTQAHFVSRVHNKSQFYIWAAMQRRLGELIHLYMWRLGELIQLYMCFFTSDAKIASYYLQPQKLCF